MKLACVITMVAGALFTLPAYAVSPNIDAGEWEYESKMDIPGMPANMATRTFKACMDKDNPVPRGVQNRDDGSCKATHKTVSRDTVSWTVRCTHGNRVSETKGTGTYRGSTMNATQIVDVGDGKTMTINFTGRRIGPCKE